MTRADPVIGPAPRILIVKMWALGDVLMATSLAATLKRAWPESRITWLVEEKHAPILEGNPHVNAVIPFDSRAWRAEIRRGRVGAYAATAHRLRRRLVGKFDVGLNLTADKLWSRLLVPAPVRVALFSERGAGWQSALYDRVVVRADRPELHNIRQYLRVAEALAIPPPYCESMVLHVTDERRQQVAEFLGGQRSYRADQPIVAVQLGASAPTKMWPGDSLAALCRALGAVNVVLTGSPLERSAAEQVAERGGGRAIVAAGGLPHLQQLAALIERSSALVTGDTAALHIATAVGTPVVALYGSTRPRVNAPLTGSRALLFDDSVACAPCYRAQCALAADEAMRCMAAVTPAAVLTALARLGVPSPAPAEMGG